MRKTVVLLLLGSSMAAQSVPSTPAVSGANSAVRAVPKVEIGIGYSYARMPVPVIAKSVNNHALAIDVTAYLNRYLGMTGEFDAYYHCVSGCAPYTDLARNNSFVVLGGPKLRLARGRYVPWIHALGGYANLRYSEDLGPLRDSWNGAAAAMGGGIDMNWGRFGFRLGQVDYFRTPGPLGHNHVRITSGFVVNLGTRVK